MLFINSLTEAKRSLWVSAKSRPWQQEEGRKAVAKAAGYVSDTSQGSYLYLLRNSSVFISALAIQSFSPFLTCLQWKFSAIDRNEFVTWDQALQPAYGCRIL